MNIREQLAIPRQLPRELNPEERLDNFDEVSKGFDEQTAILEAQRCLQCRKPLCIMGCPIGNDIPRFIELLRQSKFEQAYWTIRETSSMPSVCGRVCPQEFQCEGACIRGKKDQPVAIGLLERFLADWMIINGKNLSPRCAPNNGIKVAVIGSGPAGITVAHALAHKGYGCTVFESLPVFGGMLSVGIPNYRLPRNIIGAELYALQQCGVNVKTGITVGRDLMLSELRDQGYASVFLGIGAYESRRLGLEGETETKGVMSGVDYLGQVLTGREIALGDKVIVVGGGNVAIDVARVALRSGWKEVTILYRRTREEMPASVVEINHVEEEAVRLIFLAAPVRILSEDGRLTGVECVAYGARRTGPFGPPPAGTDRRLALHPGSRCPDCCGWSESHTGARRNRTGGNYRTGHLCGRSGHPPDQRGMDLCRRRYCPRPADSGQGSLPRPGRCGIHAPLHAGQDLSNTPSNHFTPQL